MWARQVIEDRLQKARDNLDALDKNLKRISGRPESRNLSAKRRIGIAGSDGASVKSRLLGGGGLAQRSISGPARDVTEKKDDYLSDEELSRNGPSVKSNVTMTVKPEAEQQSAKFTPDSMTKERGKRFFGILTRTLHSFQEKENEKKPTQAKRAEVEKKVDAAQKLEKAEAAVERREMFRERLMREEEIVQLNAKMDRAQMLEDWEAAMQKSKGNIMTNSRPPIFYRPNAFNKKLTELQKRTERYIDGLIWEREEEMKQELHILPTEEGRKVNNGTNAAGVGGGGGAKGTLTLPAAVRSLSSAAAATGSAVPEALSSSSSSANKDNKKVAGKVKNQLSEISSTHASSEVGKVQPLPQSGIQAPPEDATDQVGSAVGSEVIKVGEETLAEELGAPGEDIENLLVEEPNNEAQKKENTAVTPTIASAVVIQTETSDKTTSEQHTPVEKSSSKKQRNYRQRSKSHSTENKKKRDSSPLKVSGKADNKSETKREASKKDVKSSGEKQRKHTSRRSSEKSRERKNRSVTPDEKKRKSDTSKDTKEKGAAVKRSRPSEKNRPLPKSRKSDSIEKTEQISARKEKKRDSSSSSRSSSDNEKHQKKPVSVKQPKDQINEASVSKDNKNGELRKSEKTIDPNSYSSTFGSELQKVKHMTKEAQAKPEPNILLPPVKLSDKIERKKVDEDKVISTTISTEVAKPAPVVAVTTTPVEPPKIVISDLNVAKPEIQIPTHSPLKSTKMFKEINPSLLPVDHENLTFKITSAFESAPTPPILAPLIPKTTPVIVASEPQNTATTSLNSDRNAIGSLSRKPVEVEEVRPETSDFYPLTVNQSKVDVERNTNAGSAHQEALPEKIAAAKSETTSNQGAAVAVASAKPDLSKKRRSPSTSSSSSSENEENSPERKERKTRRSSPPSGRKRRRNTSHKRKRSRSRRRHRPSSPRRKSSSRRRRRRTSRERRRAGGSRRRRSPAGERRRRRSPTTSSSGSSSSGSESSSGSSVSGSKP